MNVCKVCRHPKRADIDAALVRGDVLRTIADQYGTSHQALLRHKDHIPAELAKAVEETRVEQARSLMTMTLDIYDASKRALELAVSIAEEHRGDSPGPAAAALGAAAQHSKSAVSVLTLLGRVTGELQDKPTVQIDARTIAGASDIELLQQLQAELTKRLGK